MDGDKQTPLEKWVSEFKRLTPWQWDYNGNQDGKWKFKVSSKGDSINILVPYRFSDKKAKELILTVQKYYKWTAK